MDAFITLFLSPVIGAAVGFAVWYFQSRIEQLRRAQERLHDDRRKIYSGVLDPYVRLFSGLKDSNEMQKAMKQLLSFEYRRNAFEFSLIGSDDVVRAFNGMMQYVFLFDEGQGGTPPDPKKMMQLWGAFLLEIRRSVGDSKTTLTERDMLRGYIKQIDKYLDQ